jgi:superfamily II DNA or RNA helicase
MYEVPQDDIVGEVLVPAMANSETVNAGAGFFSSRCFAQLAPGLASFLDASQKPLRMLISPELRTQDVEAIKLAATNPEIVVQDTLAKLFESASIDPSKIVKHSIDCLAYLLAAGRLELKVVLMPAGQYHKKFWLFYDGVDHVAVHGSGNATERGMLVNGEQMSVSVSWTGESAALRSIEKLALGWERDWKNENKHYKTFIASKALEVLKRMAPKEVPTLKDFWDAWREDYEHNIEPPLPVSVLSKVSETLKIPDWLQWRDGAYKHQGEAVDEFESNGRRGLLAIATGGGKTKTSLISATRAQDDSQGGFVVLILVPSSPLEAQWSQEVVEFGIAPVRLSKLQTGKRHVKLSELLAVYAAGSGETTVLVSTNSLFAQDQQLKGFLERVSAFASTMLIGDEVHNLGAGSFVNKPPEFFEFRLGLSATPVRQYDPDGTDKLLDFFGGQIYEFSLEQAIAAGCLVPYNYYLIEVLMDEYEFEEYQKLTMQIVKAGASEDDDGRSDFSSSLVSRLLMKRRSLIEHVGDKTRALRLLLTELRGDLLSKTLIYASAKQTPPDQEKQIATVNAMLKEMGVPFHQITSEETASGAAKVHLDRFASGDLKVLTAMKVLDEGVDLPQTDTAVLLASSAVEREWVQRRGRVLRSAPGKEVASIYDFLVVPPSLDNSQAKSLLRSELTRIEAFAMASQNEWSAGGPRSIIQKYEQYR